MTSLTSFHPHFFARNCSNRILGYIKRKSRQNAPKRPNFNRTPVIGSLPSNCPVSRTTDADRAEQCEDCSRSKNAPRLIIKHNKHGVRNGLHDKRNSLESARMLSLCENRLLVYSHTFLLFFDSVIRWTYRSSEHMLRRPKNQRRLYRNPDLAATFSKSTDQSPADAGFLRQFCQISRTSNMSLKQFFFFKYKTKPDLLLYPTAVECSRSMPGPDSVNPFTA